MLLLEYIILGIIQGFTEPIPISSSGHLVLFKNIFDFEVLNDLSFEIILNFGSFLAIFFLYRKRIFTLIHDFFLYIKTRNQKYYKNFKYAMYIIIGTIPAGLLGLLFNDKIAYFGNNVKVIGVALLVTALALFVIRNMNGRKNQNEITYKDAIKVGLFQAVALLPGISRSGATIVGGLLCDIKKEDAVDFSFMLYLPISFASMILGVKDLVSNPSLTTLILPYLLGMVAAMIVTYFSTKLFLNLVKEKKLIYFVIYCAIVGTLTLLFL